MHLQRTTSRDRSIGQFGIGQLGIVFLLAASPACAMPAAPAPDTVDQGGFAQTCVCLCFAGRPRTVCTTRAAAQANARACTDAAVCASTPVEEETPAAPDILLQPPHEDTFGCRATYARRPDAAAPSIPVKVCHVRPG